MAFYKLGTREGGVNPTGNAVEANVLKDKTFSNASGINKIGTMPNNGAVSPTALSPNGSYIIPLGYHNGNGVVSASPNTGTYSPTTRNAALDMGINNLNRYVNTTGVPNSNTETYTASSRGASLDMGATNNYRYVNTNGVPNSNSGTYTFPANDTGGTKDLGETNTYRYVNASNVYNKGKADGSSLNLKYISNSGNSWTSDKDYKEIYAIGVRGSVPTLTYTGNGTVTELGRLYATAHSLYLVVYKISPCNKNDKITNNYLSAVLAIP